MSTGTQGYRLELSRTHAVLSLEPQMGSAAWGDIDRVGNDLISRVSGQSSPAWLIDLSRLEYMGSALVALVVRVWKAVQSGGGRVVVVCGHGMPQEVLRLAGLDKVWTIVPTYEDGLRRLGVSGGRGGSRMAAEGGFPLLAVLSLVCTIVSGIALGLILSGRPIQRDLVVAALLGGGVAAVILGAVALFKEYSWGRWLGGAAAVAGLAIAVIGYSKLPKTAVGPAPEKEAPKAEAAEKSAAWQHLPRNEAHA